MKNRIEKNGFIENQDFEVFHNFMENSQSGRPLTEYALSVDAAKELLMLMIISLIFDNNSIHLFRGISRTKL